MIGIHSFHVTLRFRVKILFFGCVICLDWVYILFSIKLFLWVSCMFYFLEGVWFIVMFIYSDEQYESRIYPYIIVCYGLIMGLIAPYILVWSHICYFGRKGASINGQNFSSYVGAVL